MCDLLHGGGARDAAQGTAVRPLLPLAVLAPVVPALALLSVLPCPTSALIQTIDSGSSGAGWRRPHCSSCYDDGVPPAAATATAGKLQQWAWKRRHQCASRGHSGILLHSAARAHGRWWRGRAALRAAARGHVAAAAGAARRGAADCALSRGHGEGVARAVSRADGRRRRNERRWWCGTRMTGRAGRIENQE